MLCWGQSAMLSIPPYPPTGDVFLLQTKDKRNPLLYAVFSTSRYRIREGLPHSPCNIAPSPGSTGQFSVEDFLQELPRSCHLS